jgi:hypothetical protein
MDAEAVSTAESRVLLRAIEVGAQGQSLVARVTTVVLAVANVLSIDAERVVARELGVQAELGVRVARRTTRFVRQIQATRKRKKGVGSLRRFGSFEESLMNE